MQQVYNFQQLRVTGRLATCPSMSQLTLVPYDTSSPWVPKESGDPGAERIERAGVEVALGASSLGAQLTKQ